MAIFIPVAAVLGRAAIGAGVGYLAGKGLETIVNKQLEKEHIQKAVRSFIGKNKVTKTIGNILFEPKYEFRIVIHGRDEQLVVEKKEDI